MCWYQEASSSASINRDLPSLRGLSFSSYNSPTLGLPGLLAYTHHACPISCKRWPRAFCFMLVGRAYPSESHLVGSIRTSRCDFSETCNLNDITSIFFHQCCRRFCLHEWPKVPELLGSCWVQCLDRFRCKVANHRQDSFCKLQDTRCI